MTVRNPFEIKGEAERYHVSRPRYHHLPLKQIRALMERDFDYAIDVACGTGHSTEAVAQISKRVVGCDQSEAMLNEARQNSSLDFIRADAENLPFPAGTFDFLNISMGFHWVDQEKFLAEARRVLKSGGLIAIDSYGFQRQISSDPQQQKLHDELFQSYLPPASRREAYPTADMTRRTGLELVKEIEYRHTVAMSAEEFINLIMTWSNFQIQTQEQKAVTSEKMNNVYAQIFAGERLQLPFGGKTMLFRTSESAKRF